MLYKR